MKVLVQKQQLMDAINVVQKAVMQKATLQVLEGIYIEAGEKLKLVGNCFELGIACTIDADIQQTGVVVLNARMFGEIIRKLPDNLISIVVEENHLVKISCMNSMFDIKGLDPETFPLPPEMVEESIVTITQAALKDMIRQTIFAVSADENRKIMTGALLEMKDNEMTLVALDGFRMAVCHASIKEETEGRVVIPGKNLQEILKILGSNEELVRIAISGTLVTFEMKDTRIVSKTIDGEFMNYRSYIPAQFETVISCQAKELEESLERASLITSDDKRYPVRLQIAGDQLNITGSAEVGTSKENMAIKNEGGDLTIGFNPRFLIDALKVIGDVKMRMSFTSQAGPCIITPDSGEKYLFLILPVRIKA